VTISGTPKLGTGIYGVYSSFGAAIDVSTGNTLTLHSSDLAVGPNPADPVTVGGFQVFNFAMPATLIDTASAGTNAMLTAKGTANLGPNAVVGISLEGIGPALAPNTVFKLLRADTMTGSVAPASAQGTIGGYDYTVGINGNDLELRIGDLSRIGPGASNAAVPTLGEWSLALLALMLAGGMTLTRRRA
jgi:hypothetical protein